MGARKIDRDRLDAELDDLLEENDEHFQHLLARVDQVKKPDSGFIRCRNHYKKTKQVLQTLREVDLEDSGETLKINGKHT